MHVPLFWQRLCRSHSDGILHSEQYLGHISAKYRPWSRVECSVHQFFTFFFSLEKVLTNLEQSAESMQVCSLNPSGLTYLRGFGVVTLAAALDFLVVLAFIVVDSTFEV